MSGNSYRARNEVLKDMGYASYEDYLCSDLWHRIRARCFARFGTRCRMCTGRAQLIHHLSYGREVLEGRHLDPLIPLCEDCHKKLEFKPDGKKRSVIAMQTTYRRLTGAAVSILSNKPPVRRATWPGWCEKCGSKAKRRQSMCRPCSKGDVRQPAFVVIDMRLLDAGRSSNGGWLPKQIKLLYGDWPRKGWIEVVIGKRIPKRLADKFLKMNLDKIKARHKGKHRRLDNH